MSLKTRMRHVTPPLPERIKNLRELVGDLPLRAVDDQTGVPYPQLSAWENLVRKLRREQVAAITNLVRSAAQARIRELQAALAEDAEAKPNRDDGILPDRKHAARRHRFIPKLQLDTEPTPAAANVPMEEIA